MRRSREDLVERDFPLADADADGHGLLLRVHPHDLAGRVEARHPHDRPGLEVRPQLVEGGLLGGLAVEGGLLPLEFLFFPVGLVPGRERLDLRLLGLLAELLEAGQLTGLPPPPLQVPASK